MSTTQENLTSRLVSTGTSFIWCIRISFSKIESGCFLSSRSCYRQGQKARPQTCIYLQDPAQTQRPNNTNTTVPHTIRNIPLVIKTPVRDWTERKMRTTEGPSLANMHRSGSWRFSNLSMCIFALWFDWECHKEPDYLIEKMFHVIQQHLQNNVFVGWNSSQCILSWQVGCGVGNSVFPIIHSIKWVYILRSCHSYSS